MLDVKKILAEAQTIQTNLQWRDPSISLEGLEDLIKEKSRVEHEMNNTLHTKKVFSEEMRKLDKQSQEFAEKREYLTGLSNLIKKYTAKLTELKNELQKRILVLPNTIADAVPRSHNKSDKDITYVWGEKNEFDFVIQDHLSLAKKHDLIDFKRGAKLAGNGFPLYKGKGALLEWGLINFFLNIAKNNGFEYMLFPLMGNSDSLTASGNLPKFADELYKISEEDLFMIPTAESPITNLYRDEIIPAKFLPVRIVSYSPCFRREAGSYGKLTKGLLRMHQFNKVETYSICTPDQTLEEFENLIKNAKEVLESLDLHYRIANLPSCDLASQSSQTYDLEIWLPFTKQYIEVSSASNCADYQGRRANIRYKGEGKKGFVNTLNCSALATPRVLVAILEAGQEEDGSIRIPEALHDYVGFSEIK